MRLKQESGWRCKLPECGVQPHGIPGDQPVCGDYPRLTGQCLRIQVDPSSAIRKLATNVSAVSDAPHCNCVGRLQGAGRVRYSRLKGAARGEASMQIQWGWGY